MNIKESKVGPEKEGEMKLTRYSGIAWSRDTRVRDRWARVGLAYAQRWANFSKV